MNRNIILTGVPRSGTTLTCYLLNKSPDVVALHEPIKPYRVPGLGSDDNVAKRFYFFLLNIRKSPVSFNSNTVGYIDSFFEKQRTSILTKGTATSKSKGNKIPDNPMGKINQKTGKRIRVVDGRTVEISKNLGKDFTLVIKQPSMFSGLLGILSSHFQCYATIRNPLAVLCSWNTVDYPVRTGHAPAAERCDQNLKSILANEPDVYNRQIILLSWFFEQFYRHLPAENIIRYEELITSNGKSLSSMFPSSSILNQELTSKNNNPLYDQNIKKKLAKRLLDSEGYYWKYYSKNDVMDLLN